jgi:hypothetical protein
MEGSLLCHNYCDTRPRVFRTHPKDRPNIQSPLTTRFGVRSFPDQLKRFAPDIETNVNFWGSVLLIFT